MESGDSRRFGESNHQRLNRLGGERVTIYPQEEGIHALMSRFHAKVVVAVKQ